jgi:hypothetical protein
LTSRTIVGETKRVSSGAQDLPTRICGRLRYRCAPIAIFFIPARRGRKQLDVFERNLTPSQKHEDFQQRPEFNRRWTRINADERSLGISYRRPSAFIGGFLPSLCGLCGKAPLAENHYFTSVHYLLQTSMY